MTSRKSPELRFEFGRNWTSFLRTVTDDRIATAELSLREMLGVSQLSGIRFLDIGCGSGLFSLSARRLGATVHSFDYDENSVACARVLRDRYFPDDPQWTVEQGSVLDSAYLEKLGSFDTVYAWGVLHHTGDLWKAVRLAAERVGPGGRFFLAIYNDQGWRSTAWSYVKRLYCSGTLGRAAVLAAGIPYFAGVAVVAGLVKYRNPFSHFSQYRRKRGMSVVHDWIDWLGGYPFEVASYQKVCDVLASLGFSLTASKATNRLGCNEFVFKRM
jgi:SAM-dependent methyltransferase